ncbi:MAG: ParB N-terminal domain-containing protein [Nitrosopumilus sp.]
MEKVEVVKTKLRKVPIDTILIGDRFRKESVIDPNFLDSIEAKGVLQPITLNKNLELVAGGRRLTAARQLKHKTIPALIRETEDELDLRECELLENSMRKDLHWVDQVKLTNRIHNLLQEKYGDDLAKGWGQPRTAEVINRSVGGINRHVQMAKYLEMFPQLSECPTEDEAVKTVRKLIEKVQVKQMVTEHHERLAQTSDEEIKKIEDPRIRNAMSAKTHYTVGDALVGMRKMVVDGLTPPIALVEVDPPYGIDLQDKKKGMTELRLIRNYETTAMKKITLNFSQKLLL